MKKGLIILMCLIFSFGLDLFGQTEKNVFHPANHLSISIKTGKTFPLFKGRLENELQEAGFNATITESLFFFKRTTSYPVLHKANYLIGLDIAYSFKPNLSAGLYFERGPDFWFEGIYDKNDKGAFLDIHYLDYKIGTMIRWHLDHFTVNAGPVFAISKTFAEIPVYVSSEEPGIPIPGFIIPDPDHHDRISQKNALKPGLAIGFDAIFPKSSKTVNFVIGSRVYSFLGTPAFGPYEAPAFTRFSNGDFVYVDPVVFPEFKALMIQATFHLGLRINIPVKPE